MSESLGSLLFGTFAASWLLYRRYSAAITIQSIIIYPIKSCKGISVPSWHCDTSGLLFDRVYMLADKSLNYKFISQRKYPSMALITTEIDLAAGILYVNAPGMNTLSIPLPGKLVNNEIVFSAVGGAEGSVIQCDIWGDICDAIEMSEPISAWFSKYLNNENIRCIRMAPSFQRKLDTKYDNHDNHTVFSDGFPYLLTSTASIADLQSRMPSSVPVGVENFRPNLVVAGCAAYAEDKWTKITIKTKYSDSIHLEIVKPCARCKIPSIDTATGVMDPVNTVTKVMKTYRTGKHLGYSNSKWEGEVFFGQNVVSCNDSMNFMKRVSIGDVLYLT